MTFRRAVIVVIVLIVIGMVTSVAAVAVLAMFVGRPAAIPSNATVYLNVEAPFSEIEPNDLVSQFVSRNATLRQTLGVIRQAKTDDRVAALVIKPVAAGGLWAQMQELHGALLDFKTSKKPLVAFLESGGAGELYIASAADRIVLMPAGQLDLTGVASYEVFFRGTLDKIGVYPDLLHAGDYKSASNTFTERTFTAAHREMTRSLNRDLYDELVRAIASGRKMTEDAVRAAIDAGPYLAEDALKAGLVDTLGYEDQVDDADPLRGTLAVQGEQYFDGPLAQGTTDGRIALLYAVGTIASGESSYDSPSGLVLGSDTFNEWLRDVRVDPDIRAVVIRIDSPGGSAVASEVIWRELMLTREVKPVVVSMGDVAASGGYYIAAAADAIVAQPGTLTGSIGVVTGKFVVGDALEKLGVSTASVSEGRFAEINSPFRPFSAEERTRLDQQMRATYDLFVKRVADGRRESPANVHAVAQGRVWTGKQAQARKLVDDLGGLDAAIRLAKVRAKLDPAKDVDLLVYPQRRPFYEMLANPLGASLSSELDVLLRRPERRAVETAISGLRLFRRGEPLALMPNIFLH